MHIRFTLMHPVRLCTNAGVEASFIVCDSCSLSLSVIFSALCIWLGLHVLIDLFLSGHTVGFCIHSSESQLSMLVFLYRHTHM